MFQVYLLPHQGILTVGIEMVPETLVVVNQLIWLTAWEFINQQTNTHKNLTPIYNH